MVGIFGSKRTPTKPAPAGLSSLHLGSVYGWADTFLRMVGMETAEIDRLKAAYPTTVPAPNLNLTLDAGDPSNPWTLAVVCAEATIADALQVYLYAGGEFMSQEQALTVYTESGLEGLAGAIRFHEKPINLQWVHEVISDKIQKSFSNIFERMINHYLRDYWPEQKIFRVRVAR